MKLFGNKCIFAGIIFSSFFILFFFTQKTEAQTSCAQINSIQIDTIEIQPQKIFKCDVEVLSEFAGSPNIACGVSFDGAWPTDFCPSDEFFGGWQGNKARFNCVLPQKNIDTGTKIEVVAFDFRESCGPKTGKSIAINVKRDPSTTPSPNPQDDEKIFDLVRALLKTLSDPQPTKPVQTQPKPTSKFITKPPQGQPITSIQELLNVDSSQYSSQLKNTIQPCLQHQTVYQQAANYTGVPWQILAGIHYREGECGNNKSLVSGRTIGANEPDIRGNCTSQRAGLGIPKPLSGGGCGFDSLLSSAVYAGNHLKGKIGRTPQNLPDLTKALSYYNGGGNANCGKTPYAHCPRKYIGEDDTYVMNFFDEKYTPMYIVYCADYTLCNPAVRDGRPGTATAARIISGLTQ